VTSEPVDFCDLLFSKEITAKECWIEAEALEPCVKPGPLHTQPRHHLARVPACLAEELEEVENLPLFFGLGVGRERRRRSRRHRERPRDHCGRYDQHKRRKGRKGEPHRQPPGGRGSGGARRRVTRSRMPAGLLRVAEFELRAGAGADFRLNRAPLRITVRSASHAFASALATMLLRLSPAAIALRERR